MAPCRHRRRRSAAQRDGPLAAARAVRRRSIGRRRRMGRGARPTPRCHGRWAVPGAVGQPVVTFLDAAVLGTGRHGSIPVTGTPLDELTSASGDVERAVLLRAGALAVYQRAGHRAQPGVLAGDRSPADRLPEAPQPVARLLGELLQHGEPGLLREACTRLAHADLRCPAGLLPAMLDRKEPTLREVLAPVLGERGRWLAGFNPEWAWAVGPTGDAERTWLEGTFAARLEVLRAVRAADPARARSWIEAVWKDEKSEQRVELLGILVAGLEPKDEELLERVLDDRSQLVRAAAVQLLARLTDSALSRRATERVAPLLRYQPPAGGVWARVKSTLAGPP